MARKHDRRNHPCFTCPLRDCDDSSPKCPLRKALIEASTKLKKKIPLDDDLKRRRSIAYHEIYHWPKMERMRLKKEAMTAEVKV